MDREKLKESFQRLIQPYFIVKDIHDINHEPHPYCIGPRHITGKYTYLSSDVIRLLEKEGVHCAHPNCYISYDEHKADTALFLSLTQNLGNKTAAETLFTIKQMMLDNNIAGVCMVDTPEKYRIAPPEKQEE